MTRHQDSAPASPAGTGPVPRLRARSTAGHLPQDAAREAVDAYLAAGGPLSIADGSGVIGELERTAAELLGVAGTLSYNSGTSALHAAFLGLDLPPGSEVAAPVLGFHACVSPAMTAGLSAVLVDVDPLTGTMDPAALAAAAGPRTRAVVVVHYLGHPADMTAIGAVCADRGLRLVGDCSHAYLSAWRGQPVGTFGDVACWSMQERKTWTAGEGGLLAAADRGLFERALTAGHYRGRLYTELTSTRLREFAETGFGLKHRMHPLAAVVALAAAPALRDRVARRQEQLTRLSAALAAVPGITPPVIRDGADMGGWFSYRPAVPGLGGAALDRFLGRLRAAGVPAHHSDTGALDDLALFRKPVPLQAAAGTWRPRLCGPFAGARAYERGRFSVTVAGDDTPARIDGYAGAIARILGETG